MDVCVPSGLVLRFCIKKSSIFVVLTPSYELLILKTFQYSVPITRTTSEFDS